VAEGDCPTRSDGEVGLRLFLERPDTGDRPFRSSDLWRRGRLGGLFRRAAVV